MIDPNVHSCGSVPPQGAAALAGDRAAADAVQLILPEIGVCSLDRPPAAVAVTAPFELRSDLVTALDAPACCR